MTSSHSQWNRFRGWVSGLASKKVLIGAAVLVVIGGVVALRSGGSAVSYTTAPASMGPLQRIVSVTGSVESTDRLDLRFQQSGTLEAVPVQLGQKVAAGTVLGALENKQASARLAQSRAQADEARAALNILIAGASPQQVRLSAARVEEARIRSEQAATYVGDLQLQQAEDLNQAQLKLDNAASSLDLAKSDYEAAQGQSSTTNQSADADLEAAYEDAVPSLLTVMNETESSLKMIDSLWGFVDEESDTSLLVLLQKAPLSDRLGVNNAFYRARKTSEALKASYAKVSGAWTHEEIDLHLTEADQMLQDLKLAVDLTVSILNDAETTEFYVQTALDSTSADFEALQSTLNTVTSSFNAATSALENAKLGTNSSGYSSTSALNAAEDALNAAQTTYDVAVSNLAALKISQRIALNKATADRDLAANALEQAEASHADLIAPPRDADLAQANARISAAVGGVLESQEVVDNSILVAPADGIVAMVNYKAGESVNASEVAFVLLTDRLQIKANVSEVDIGGLDVGDTATLTLDAFPLSRVFDAKVATINPAETVIQGVIYYETTFIFEGDTSGIRSGMTANLDVLADSRDNVLQVPLQAVQFEGAQPYVFVLENNAKVRKDVALGLEGESNVEILSGLKEGEAVILYANN